MSQSRTVEARRSDGDDLVMVDVEWLAHRCTVGCASAPYLIKLSELHSIGNRGGGGAGAWRHPHGVSRSMQHERRIRLPRFSLSGSRGLRLPRLWMEGRWLGLARRCGLETWRLGLARRCGPCGLERWISPLKSISKWRTEQILSATFFNRRAAVDRCLPIFVN